MTITNGYLTAQEASDYIGQQFDDGTGIVDDVVTAVSRMIDHHCGRHFYSTGVTPAARLFDATTGYRIDLGAFNDLQSVSTLKTDEDGDGTWETTVSSSDYQLCPVGATARAPEAEPYTSIRLLSTASAFPLDAGNGRRGLIQITGVWGWAAVPIDVKQAARILVAEMAKLKDAPFGTVGNDVTGFFRAPTQMPARARQLLQPYVHPAHVGIG